MAEQANRRCGVICGHLAQPRLGHSAAVQTHEVLLDPSVQNKGDNRTAQGSTEVAALPKRSDFKHFHRVATRWGDNDMYGHVNNVVYYAWMDTAINHFLIQSAGFVPTEDQVVGFCVESGCTFKQSVAFPDTVECGLRVTKLGRTSVRYEVGIFPKEGSASLAALGYFVHVFVDRATQRPTPIPDRIRSSLSRLASSSSSSSTTTS